MDPGLRRKGAGSICPRAEERLRAGRLILLRLLFVFVTIMIIIIIIISITATTTTTTTTTTTISYLLCVICYELLVIS